jgi:hypothetical protein
MIYKRAKNILGEVMDDRIIQQEAAGNDPFDSTRKIIPFDPANRDYQEYLEWLAEGNEPLEADA